MSEPSKLIECIHCDAVYRVKYDMSDSHYRISYCTFCGGDLELEEEGGIDIALYIRVSHSELESRLGNRLVCRDCQAPYNTRTAAPECPGVCECGGELYQRDDDKSEAVSERIKTYMQQTEPLVDHYREVGKLREVDGELSIKQVGEQVMSVLEQ